MLMEAARGKVIAMPIHNIDPSPTYILVESPFAGEVEENLAYAQKCMRHVFFSSYGGAQIPIASHCYFTLALDDCNAAERSIGMNAGFAMRSLASEVRVYLDRGLSDGMVYGIRGAIEAGKPIKLWAFDPEAVSLEIRERLQVVPSNGKGLEVHIRKAEFEERTAYSSSDKSDVVYGGNMPIRLEAAARAAGSKLMHG